MKSRHSKRDTSVTRQ